MGRTACCLLACKCRPTRCSTGGRSISGSFSRFTTLPAPRMEAEPRGRMELPERMRQAAAIVRRNTPLILQTEAAECGLACLAMIAGRYGYRIDLPALRQSDESTVRGTKLNGRIRVVSVKQDAWR